MQRWSDDLVIRAVLVLADDLSGDCPQIPDPIRIPVRIAWGDDAEAASFAASSPA